MKRILALFLIMFTLTACAPNFSQGERVGVITKLSEKGLILKSWEGEMLIALPKDMASGAEPEKFSFTADTDAVMKLRAAMYNGNRVIVSYKQWFFAPPTVDTRYIVFDVR